MYSKILIRYGELTLKGKNRDSFINLLAKNIKRITGEKPIVEFDRMYLTYSEENLENLKYVFGIISYSPIIECENDIEIIKQKSLLLINNENKTFKVSARRNNKSFNNTSNEINNIIGSHVLQNSNLKVDVHNPDLTIFVEVRGKSTYIFDKVIQALGGLPVGISGRVLHLMSGGIDSPVAAFELMKRGMHVSYLSFVSPPQTDIKTIEKMKNIVSILNKYQGNSIFYIANYSKLMNYITFVSNESYKINLMRRSFYRIASRKAKELNILALSNGENLGQVASQTLESLSTIANASDLLIFRPLLTNDKIETIEIAKKIGTYEPSIIKANETCELFAPKQPVTKPTLEKSLEYEKELAQIPNFEDEILNSLIEEHHFNN
ncbi:thiamine biosynthesis protein ThiI [Mycoplasmopsis maculosa]|uniref:Probable tRNA sulfurtransferase n=1 Tax=Mycoplasmopsis maculosa TaxID=114885 RepID=A0A449B5J6_9BACT|nr:tRNA uracil 4-sulfurtransferase ThiI [Mycoplasmopsis maculosa]VEU75798.1 thiamine biosynthesis protein ThiI [Mycoplasmopsis maculosa]